MLSGLAMAIAGTSRPCSGSEHRISPALNYLYGGVAGHGLQVALATVPVLPDLGLTSAHIAELARQAPRIRPGRCTILDVAGPAPVERVLGVSAPSYRQAGP